MDAFAVFEGGGVKGAAFSGAIKAAEMHNIKFAGYGGASAGAIVAYLSALGYSGDDIHKVMKQFPLSSMINEPKKGDLLRSKIFIYKVIDFYKHLKIKELNPFFKRWPFIKYSHFLFFIIALYLLSHNLIFLGLAFFSLPCVISLLMITFSFVFVSLVSHTKELSSLVNVFSFAIKGLYNKNGIFNDRNIISLMSYYMELQYPGSVEWNVENEECEISFRKFYDLTGKDLKIIATDLNTGKATIFSASDTPDFCVFQAVSASSTYPFFFRPKIHIFDGVERNYVDGGVSCNLPTFLFDDDKYKNLPIFAFDLFKPGEDEPKKSPQNVISLSMRVIGSLLDASNNILSDVVGGIRVPVAVPNHISTLDFSLPSDVLDELFQSGFKSAHHFFQSNQLIRFLSTNLSDRDKAKLLYGDYHEPVLRALVNDIDYSNATIPVKAWLYTSINAIDDMIISFSEFSNMGGGNQHSFSLNDDTKDCVQSWKKRKITISEDRKKRKSRVCFPIITNTYEIKNGVQSYLDPQSDIKYSKHRTLGVLCVSIDTLIDECVWFDCTNELDVDFMNIALSYIHIIENSMQGSLTNFNMYKD